MSGSNRYAVVIPTVPRSRKTAVGHAMRARRPRRAARSDARVVSRNTSGTEGKRREIPKPIAEAMRKGRDIRAA
jgi:hypothetical protein